MLVLQSLRPLRLILNRRCPFDSFHPRLRSHSSFEQSHGDDVQSKYGVPVEPLKKGYSQPFEEISVEPGMENAVQLVGYLGRDPEFLEFKTGNCKAVMSLGVTTRRTRRKQWFETHVWGPLAISAKERLRKGQVIVIQGRLYQDVWTDHHERRRSKVVVLAKNIHLPKHPTGHEYPQHLRSGRSNEGTPPADDAEKSDEDWVVPDRTDIDDDDTDLDPPSLPVTSSSDAERERSSLEDIERSIAEGHSIDPHDCLSDDGRPRMPKIVERIIWSKQFPVVDDLTWLPYVNALSTEDLWKLLFQRPKEFWDAKGRKRKIQKDPCFRHILTDRPMWVDRNTTPEWARLNLKFLGTTALYPIDP